MTGVRACIRACLQRLRGLDMLELLGLLLTPLRPSSSYGHEHNRSIRQGTRGLRMSSAALVPTQGGFAVAVRSASPTGSDMPSMTLAL